MSRAILTIALCAALCACAAPAFGQGAAYTIPPDNPFASTPGARPEIALLGMRNPWRFSFDRLNGDIVVGDVGWDLREEATLVPRASTLGANLGWSCFEGDQPGPHSCTPSNYFPPQISYDSGPGSKAVTGGYVVRDPALPSFAGRYLYADFFDGDVLSTQLSAGGATAPVNTGVHLDNLSSFGEDGVGRLYATSLDGPVRRLTESAGTLGTQVVGDFDQPTFATSPPGDSSRVFVTEKAGRVMVQTGGSKETFLDIASQIDDGGERGLLSIAFAPNYSSSGLVYVFFTVTTGDVRIDEFKVAAGNPNRADPASQRQVLFQEHSSFSNHNGGQLQFGPDNMLYASIGDGGAQGDPDENGQGLDTLLGKVSRINPFIGGTGPGGGGGGGNGGGGEMVEDSQAPTLRVRVPRVQRIVRNKGVIAYVRTTEIGRIQATGRLVVGNASRSFRLRTVRRSARPGRRYRVKLRLSRRALRAGWRALRSGRRVRATLRLTALDAAGNARASRRGVRARR